MLVWCASHRTDLAVERPTKVHGFFRGLVDFLRDLVKHVVYSGRSRGEMVWLAQLVEHTILANEEVGEENVVEEKAMGSHDNAFSTWKRRPLDALSYAPQRWREAKSHIFGESKNQESKISERIKELKNQRTNYSLGF